MKVISVNPGTVFAADPVIGSFYFSYFINAVRVRSDGTYSSARAAKQAMREHVSFLRKKHGLSGLFGSV